MEAANIPGLSLEVDGEYFMIHHTQADTVDKIDFPKLTRTSRLVFSSTLQVANYEGRPSVDNRQFIEITRSRPERKSAVRPSVARPVSLGSTRTSASEMRPSSVEGGSGPVWRRMPSRRRSKS